MRASRRMRYLPKSVPALDLIVSGHTHTELSERIVHNDTSIVSVGEYGKKLGSLSMEQRKNGRWKVTDYSRIAVTADIPADAGVQERVNGFMAAVDDRLSRGIWIYEGYGAGAE